MPSAPTSSGELIDLLRKSGVATPEKLAGVSDLALPGDPQKAAAALVAQGVVTRFQAQQLLAGRHRGFRIGAYVIQDLLGRGGMGAVYLAEHLELHRKVAIKVLIPGKDDDHRLALERFQREARAAAALDHPNIVRIFDVARQHDAPYLVMEYVDGETLQQVLDRDGAVPYPTAAEYIAQAAAGLQHAHEKGFIHRDIKPSNLMLDKTGTVKILDMGLARSADAQDRLTELFDKGAVVGTADFIAPEQGLNQPGVDGRADIYSLGATFFALIIGKPPFEGSTTQKLLQHQLRSAPSLTSLDSTLPKGLSAVAAKMLAKKPDDRYRCPAEVIAALAPWMVNSARIMAGLTRTKLAQGADLQATLAEIARGGPRRPGTPSDAGEEVDPSAAARDRETGEIAGAATTLDARKPAAARPPLPRKKLLLYGGIGAAILVAGTLVGWAAFGGKKQPEPPPGADTRPRSEQETRPRPAPSTKPPAPETPADEKALFRMDLAGQRAFVIRSGLAAEPNRQDYRLVSQTGAEPPTGWSARVWNKASEMEYFSQEVNGKPALGIRAASGPGSAMLFMPRFGCPTGACRLRFEYDANVRDGRFQVRFKPSDTRPAWDVVKPPVTGGAWRAEEVEVDLRGATGGQFEFHNSDDRPSSAVRIRALLVTESKAYVAGGSRVVYRLDLSKQKPFRARGGGEGTGTPGRDVRFVQTEKTGEGDWPAGWSGMPWDHDGEAEYWAEAVGGRTALGMRNLGKVSAMMLSPDVTVASRRCRMRFEYMADGDSPKAALLKFKGAGQTNEAGLQELAFLDGTGGRWKTEEADAVLKFPAGFFEFHALDGDPQHAFRVRSFEVTELGAVGAPAAVTPPPPTPPAEDFAGWTEGKTLYSLDIAKIPAFRVVKEQYNRTGGAAERLPTGVACQSWKEGAVGEFRCEKLDGVPALGVVNLNNEKAGQFYFQLEGEMNLPLEPGKTYRVKVGYQTRNDAAGHVAVQVTPGYKGIASRPLPNTEGKWAEAAVTFVRPPAGDNVEVRMTIDNDAVGEGNTLWFRSVEIVELVPPKK